MRFILDPRCSLRGWKNRPFNISMDQSPLPPVRISEELCARLGRSIEYSGNDPETEQLIDKGILRSCADDAELTEGQGYRNYGCLHFDSVIFSITGKCNYNCMHCSVNVPASPMGEMSMERICELFDEMITVQGGQTVRMAASMTGKPKKGEKGNEILQVCQKCRLELTE